MHLARTADATKLVRRVSNKFLGNEIAQALDRLTVRMRRGVPRIKRMDAPGKQADRMVNKHVTAAMRGRCTAAWAGLVMALLLVSGCSLSYSSESISKSVSSSSRSSSPEDAYREDVQDFTAAHVQS